VTTHLERELREQPSALHRLLANQRGSAERVAALFRRADVEYVLIASRGSSSNAARYPQPLLRPAHRVKHDFATT
jgi:fructoselysine-6-P-deglycase FrlB-like protein